VTAAHFIYIPMLLMLGAVLGFFLGGRAARDAFELKKKKDEARRARQREREAPPPA
jgi:hypothetical protein